MKRRHFTGVDEYGCDSCERWGYPMIKWDKMPGRKGHFALCCHCFEGIRLLQTNWKFWEAWEQKRDG